MAAATALYSPTVPYQIANESGVPGNEQVDIRIPHFFVQMGWNVLHVDSSAVRYAEKSGKSVEVEYETELGEIKRERRPEMRMVYRTIPRGRIVPCVSYQQIALLYEIPEVGLIKGSESSDPQGKQVYGKYWRWAGDEAQHLNELEEGKSRKDGLVEIKGLLGPDSVLYGQSGSINSLFFPDGFASLPEKNVDLIEHLKTRCQILKESASTELPLAYKPKLLAIGDEMVAAAELADSIQRRRLEYTHTCRKLAPSDDLFKPDYDAVDEEMLKRTGVPRIHAADIQTADALKLLSENSTGSGLDRLLSKQQEQIDLMRQQMENQTALIQHLIAANGADAPARTKQPAR